jgi:methionyl-tRNA formyltransferase
MKVRRSKERRHEHRANPGLALGIAAAPLASVALDNGLETTQVPYENFKQWKVRALLAVFKPASSSLTLRLRSSFTQPPRPFDALSPSHVLVTASFGAILPKSVLGLLPPHQTLNVHPSLLPRYRGASPIQYALLNRDQTTGVTVQELSDRGADTGAIFAQEEFVSGLVRVCCQSFALTPTSDQDIPPNATYGSLVAPLADLGGSLLVKTLETLADGTVRQPARSACASCWLVTDQPLLYRLRPRCRAQTVSSRRRRSAKSWPRSTLAGALPRSTRCIARSDTRCARCPDPTQASRTC